MLNIIANLLQLLASCAQDHKIRSEDWQGQAGDPDMSNQVY